MSRIIHGHVSEAIEPLLETKPKYHAIDEILGTVGKAINQLAGIQRQRKVKSTQDLRGTGGKDGIVGKDQVSQRKRDTYLARQGHMRRLRQAFKWQVQDIGLTDSDLTPEQVLAVKRLNQMLDRRIDRFEWLNYEESHTEFDNFISDIEENPSASGGLVALELMGQLSLYQRMKAKHLAYIEIHKEQTELDALREESPKFPRAQRELRRAIRVLLTVIHFDIENGDTTLAKVLGDIDEVIDKARAVGKRRETIAEQESQETPETPETQEPPEGQTQADDQPQDSNQPAGPVTSGATTAVTPEAEVETEVAQG